MMNGPHSLLSSKVNEILRNDDTSYTRTMFLVRIELLIAYLPPSAMRPFVQIMLIEQAAREAGLETSETPASSIDDETQKKLKTITIELAELLAAAGLITP